MHGRAIAAPEMLPCVIITILYSSSSFSVDGGWSFSGSISFKPIHGHNARDPEFEKWAKQLWNFGSRLGAEVSLKDFRKDPIIDMHNEAGQPMLSYRVHHAWVSEFQALPDLDANANAAAIQTLKLENEGWERDYDVTDRRSRFSTSPPDRDPNCVRTPMAMPSRSRFRRLPRW